jgi:hypothetical protein
MKPHNMGGNGSTKLCIHTTDLGGWIRVFPERYHSLPEELPVWLSNSLTEWFRQRPQLRLRTVVPITRDGNTVELHAWFDVHVMPAPRPPEQQPPQKSESA